MLETVPVVEVRFLCGVLCNLCQLVVTDSAMKVVCGLT